MIARLILENIFFNEGVETFFDFLLRLYQLWYEKIESKGELSLSHHMRALESPKVHENIIFLITDRTGIFRQETGPVTC